MSDSESSCQPHRVAYIWSEELQHVADQLPSNIGRSTVVHDLIKSLDLLDIVGDDNQCHVSEYGYGAKENHGPIGRRARVVEPDVERFGRREHLERYHDKKYVDYLLSAGDTDSSEDEGSSSLDGSDSSASRGLERKSKRRKTEHGLEHDCPKFPALPRYAHLVSSATLTACQQLLDPSHPADIAICWDGGRHHALRNRASGFCYVADVVLGIMHLAKSDRPRGTASPLAAASTSRTIENVASDRESATTHTEADDQAEHDGREEDSTLTEKPTSSRATLNGPALQSSTCKPGRKARIMYLDLDIHEGDGVHQAFLSPTHFPASLPAGKRPPRLPQVLTLSVHHHSRTFFPPHRPFSGLPAPNTPHPFTLSIPLHACPSPGTYKAIWDSVQHVKEAFDPDYVILQLGVDGLPGDRVGQYGAWAVHGDGGVVWCVNKVKEWGLPLVVLGGGGYNNPNSARAWATATSVLLDRPLNEHTQIPHHSHFPLYSPSFTLEVPPSHATDENTPEHLDMIKGNFTAIARRIRELVLSATQ